MAGNSGVPWVIGGDFQDTPQEIGQWASEMIDRAKGRIIHGKEPKVYPSSGVPRVMQHGGYGRSRYKTGDIPTLGGIVDS